jgi:hypothetical protein
MRLETLTIGISKDKSMAHCKHVLLYARASSTEQEDWRFTVEAQLRTLRDFAMKRGLRRESAEELCDLKP